MTRLFLLFLGFLILTPAAQAVDNPLASLREIYGKRVDIVLEGDPDLLKVIESGKAKSTTEAWDFFTQKLSTAHLRAISKRLEEVIILRSLLETLTKNLPNGYHDVAANNPSLRPIYTQKLEKSGLTMENLTPSSAASQMSEWDQNYILTRIAGRLAALSAIEKMRSIEIFVSQSKSASN